LEEKEFLDGFPKAFAYLKSRRGDLVKRKQYRSWFAFSAPRNLDLHQRAHLMVPLLASAGSETMLALQTKLSAARTADDKAALRRQIDATDRQIDELVYDLYGLTGEEVNIVKQASKRT
jgi:hypothetical protein